MSGSRIGGAVGLLLLLVSIASADQGRGGGATPWSQGVTEQQKEVAQKHLEVGNARFLEAQYQEALEQYQQAIAAWDHPAIRFNIVRVLVNLGRNIEAWDNLELALKYGEAPLEPQVYAEALTLKAVLTSSLGQVEVSCKEAGAVVTLDGQVLLTCPGTAVRRLVPGAHAVVAKKAGYLTASREELVLGGKKSVIGIEMIPLREAAVTRRRWAAWKPWAVVGGGAVMAGLGGLLQLKAARDFDTYDSEVDRQCAEVGCGPGNELPQTTIDLEARAGLENKLAIGMMAVGGAAVAGGLVLLWLNRPVTWVPTESSRASVSLSPGQASLDLAFRF